MIYKEMGLFLQSEMVDIIYGFQELGFTISLGGGGWRWVGFFTSLHKLRDKLDECCMGTSGTGIL